MMREKVNLIREIVQTLKPQGPWPVMSFGQQGEQFGESKFPLNILDLEVNAGPFL